MKRITILGSTGSIGTQTLDVVAMHQDLFQIEALSAGRNLNLLIEQVHKYHPKLICVADEQDVYNIRGHIPNHIQVVYGDEGLIDTVGIDTDVVVTAISGSRGLLPTLSAIQKGRTIALANKETLVAAGHLVMDAAKHFGATIIPVDSEHSAIFQCLNGVPTQSIRRLLITASGGSFRDKTRDELQNATISDALNHPNWSMGAKITIDSATMCNKGLEVIEAHWLFDMPFSKIDVLMHPQSIIHSMVEFVDTGIIAQLGVPDMRVPIQYALTFPQRLQTPVKSLDFTQKRCLDFHKPDLVRFPCLRMAYDAGNHGGTMPAVFNAANEVAVQLFLEGRITFLEIEQCIETAMNTHPVISSPTLEEVIDADQWARQQVISHL